MKKISLNQNEPITMSECFEQYIVRCKVRNLSEKTIGIYKVHFSVLEKYSKAANWSLDTISPYQIDGFVLYLKERGCNDITVQSYLRDLRAFFYFCMENEWMPQFKIKLPKADKKIKETYIDEELRILLKNPNLKVSDFTEYKTWVYSNYLLATGNRISSALNITIGDLDFNNQLIQMNTSKNRKAQIIPMSDSLMIILKEYLTYRKGVTSDYLFCNSYGGKSDLRTYQEIYLYDDKIVLVWNYKDSTKTVSLKDIESSDLSLNAAFS